ncbi:MAG: sigma-70 family RNA polymerase sigma factor [Planctomycetota bacterium]
MPPSRSDGEPPQDARDSGEAAVLAAAAAGDLAPIGRALEGYRPRLERVIRARLDAPLARRVDVADVVQETFLEVTKRLPTYLSQRTGAGEDGLPLFLWVRFLAAQCLAQARRTHLGVAARDAGREARTGDFPAATSVHLASILEGKLTSPTQALAREEQRAQLARALEALEHRDREVLVLRHFEHLSNAEIARLLGITEPGASLRHMRALQRLQAVVRTLGLEFTGGMG